MTTSAPNPFFENLQREHSFESLRVEGKIPDELLGTLYRAGPGLFERFGKRVIHPFEADGAISAVRFNSGKAEGAAKIVRGAGFHEEEAANRFQ